MILLVSLFTHLYMTVLFTMSSTSTFGGVILTLPATIVIHSLFLSKSSFVTSTHFVFNVYSMYTSFGRSRKPLPMESFGPLLLKPFLRMRKHNSTLHQNSEQKSPTKQYNSKHTITCQYHNSNVKLQISKSINLKGKNSF